MGNALFVNPDFIFEGDKPTAVGVDMFALDIERRWGCGIVDFDVQLMLTGWNQKCFRHAKLQFSVDIFTGILKHIFRSVFAEIPDQFGFVSLTCLFAESQVSISLARKFNALEKYSMPF